MNIFKKPNFDFLAIGDIAINDFIKIKEADIENDEKNGNQEICLNFGTKIPYENNYLVLASGNSANASVVASRLGLKSSLVTNLGNDNYGTLCLTSLKEAGVDTKLSTRHKNLKTNYHYILWYKDNRTILTKHEKYPYNLPNIGEPKWIYLSSLGKNSLPFHNQLADYLENHPKIKLVFQPGTYQISTGAQELSRIYSRTELFFCNLSEAKKILQSDSSDIRLLAQGLRALGPKTIFITDNINGAYYYQNNELKHLPVYPCTKPPLETTGAGDSFSSTVTAGIALGLSTEDAVKWGLINASSVIQKIGSQAGLLTQKEIKEYLAKAPASFRTETI